MCNDWCFFLSLSLGMVGWERGVYEEEIKREGIQPI